MKIKRIIIGSTNPGKVNEWSGFFEKVIKVISISDLGKFPKPNEIGKTFSENARIKARHYAFLTQEFVFSED